MALTGTTMQTGQQLFERATKIMLQKKPNAGVAFELFEKAQAKGDPYAAYALATWYLHGRHVKKNTQKCIALLQEAVKGNVADAAMDLAICYERGFGVRPNKKTAFELYVKAATLSVTIDRARTMYGADETFEEVGRCFYYGIGISKNRQVAKAWLDGAQRLQASIKRKGPGTSKVNIKLRKVAL